MKRIFNFKLTNAIAFATLLFVFLVVMNFTLQSAEIKNAKTEKVKIYGNCGKCEKTIENAAYVENQASAEWNKKSKFAMITFDSSQTNLDIVLKRIADAGYDSEKYTANNEAYNKLHECCKYDRKK
jgi:copper chaperone CopZ